MCLDRMSEGTLKQAISCHKPVYSIGLQGPDIYFYYPFIMFRNGMHNLGSIMHEAGTEKYFRVSMDTIADMGDGFEKECALAYLAGFISHYIFDACCHPYVYARIGYEKDGPGGKKSMKHARLENDLDVILLNKYYGRFPGKHVPSSLTAYTTHEKMALTQFMSDSVTKTYSDAGKKHSFRLTRQSAARILAFFRKEISLRPIHERLSEPREQVLNLDKHMWRNSWDINITSRLSFPELFDIAFDENMRAFSMLGTWADECSPGHREALLEYLGNRSYHSGLEN